MANTKKFENVSKIVFRMESTTKERIDKALVSGQSVNDFINGSVLLQLSAQEKAKGSNHANRNTN